MTWDIGMNLASAPIAALFVETMSFLQQHFLFPNDYLMRVQDRTLGRVQEESGIQGDCEPQQKYFVNWRSRKEGLATSVVRSALP